MSVPDFRHVPQKLFATGLYNLKTEDGMGAFVDAVVATLHGLDERFGHLRKSASQTQVHGHGEDAVLYLSDVDGESQAVDFVGGAGGPNPQPAWQVDAPRYSKKDWIDPFDHGLRENAHTCPPVPTFLPKGEAFARLQALNTFYAAPEGLQRPGGLIRDGQADMEAIAQWFYQMVIEGVGLEDVFTQIRNSHEWKVKHP